MVTSPTRLEEGKMKTKGLAPLTWERMNKKGKRGVSPIIATILLVAITVVLAAVLYVLVSGYVGHSASAPIAIGWSQIVAGNNAGKTNYYYNATVQSVSPTGLKWSEISTISIKNSGGGAVPTTGDVIQVVPAAGGTAITYTPGTGWGTGAGVAISSGDTLEVETVGAGNLALGGSIVLSPSSSYSGTSTLALPS